MSKLDIDKDGIDAAHKAVGEALSYQPLRSIDYVEIVVKAYLAVVYAKQVKASRA